MNRETIPGVSIQAQLFHRFATTEFPGQIDVLDNSQDCKAAIMKMNGAHAFVTRAAGHVSGRGDSYAHAASALDRTLASARLRAPAQRKCPEPTIKALRARAGDLARETDPQRLLQAPFAQTRSPAGSPLSLPVALPHPTTSF